MPSDELQKWNHLFCRVADRDANMPRFSLIGSKGYLYEFDGYFGGHEQLDQIITILEKNGIKRNSSGSYNPGSSVSAYEWVYDFEDGGLEIYSGNYLFHAPGQALSLLGSRHSVGCSINLELSNPADSRTRSPQSNFLQQAWKPCGTCRGIGMRSLMRASATAAQCAR